MKDYPMETLEDIQKEILHQQDIGVLPQDNTKTKILLHIDKNAPWDPIARLIYAIKEIGFEANPIYKTQKEP